MDLSCFEDVPVRHHIDGEDFVLREGDGRGDCGHMNDGVGTTGGGDDLTEVGHFCFHEVSALIGARFDVSVDRLVAVPEKLGDDVLSSAAGAAGDDNVHLVSIAFSI